ncbi:MAG: Holliday junction resolvase RuvX [Flavobacteriaceae bacterium]
MIEVYLEMRIYVGIDFGTKRSGVALSDPTHTIASALDTFDTSQLIPALQSLKGQYTIAGFVVGAPRRWSGEPSTVEVAIQEWIAQLEKDFSETPIFREDERFTSKIAQKSLLEGGVKKSKRKDKKILDSMSATLILQSFLDRQKKCL